MTDPLQENYPESRVAGFSNIDGTIAFYSRVNALIEPDHVVADVGCGRGAHVEDPVGYRRQLRVLKGRVARVIGIDVDPAGAENPFLDEFRPIDGTRWPLDDGSVNLIVADYVLEHVSEPDAFFAECGRVLRAGGYVCIRTANRHGYVALVSRLVPQRAHAWLLERVQRGRQGRDVFPTVYACNTRHELRRALERHGLSAVVYTHEAEPSYLQFSSLLYRVGVWHQRYIPSALRVGLVAFGRKGMPPQ